MQRHMSRFRYQHDVTVLPLRMIGSKHAQKNLPEHHFLFLKTSINIQQYHCILNHLIYQASPSTKSSNTGTDACKNTSYIGHVTGVHCDNNHRAPIPRWFWRKSLPRAATLRYPPAAPKGPSSRSKHPFLKHLITINNQRKSRYQQLLPYMDTKIRLCIFHPTRSITWSVIICIDRE
jgi:hypothetical protein